MILRIPYLAPAVFVVLWSTGFIGAKYGLPYAEPLTFLTLRFALVLALIIPWAIISKAPWPTSWSQVFHSIVAGLLIHGAYLTGVWTAVKHGLPAGPVSIIVSLQPVLTAALAAPLLGERLNKIQWTGIILGLAGLVLVVWPKLTASTDGWPLDTLFYATIGLLGITFGSLYQKRFATATDLRTGNILQYSGVLVFCGIGAALFETNQITWHPDFIFALGWLVLVLSIGAITLLMYLIRHGGVSEVAALFFLVPPVTALMAWVVFHETLSFIQLIGMCATSCGVALVSRRSPKV